MEPLQGHEAMAGRICIPYIKKCATVALKFRCIKDHECKEVGCSKYLSDGQQWLFNTADVDVPSSFIGIAEGEFDAIILHQAGIPSVGIPGVDAWKSHPWWPELLKKHKRTLVFADNDSSKERNYGHELAKKIQGTLLRARLVHLPENHDVTDTYLTEGAEGLFKRAGLSEDSPALVLAA